MWAKKYSFLIILLIFLAAEVFNPNVFATLNAMVKQISDSGLLLSGRGASPGYYFRQNSSNRNNFYWDHQMYPLRQKCSCEECVEYEEDGDDYENYDNVMI